MTYFPCAECPQSVPGPVASCPIDCDFANMVKSQAGLANIDSTEPCCCICGYPLPDLPNTCQSCPNSGGIDIDMSQLGGLGRDLVRLALTLQFKLRHDDLPANRENSAFLTKVGEQLTKVGKFMWDLEESWEGGKD